MPVTPITWTSLTNATVNGDGDLVKTGGADVCASTVTGNAGAKSSQTISGGDWKFECTLGPLEDEAGRTYIGLDGGSFSLDYTTWQYCFYVNSQPQSPYPGGTVRIYEGGAQKSYIEGAFSVGDLLQIICINGVVRYYLNSRLLYTSSAAPSYPLFACASMACPGSSVISPAFVDGLDLHAKSSCGVLNCDQTPVGSLNFAGGFQSLEQLVYPANPSTWGLWLRIEALPSGGNFSSVLALGNGSGWSIVIDDAGRLGFRTDSGIYYGSTLALRTWYHVALTTALGSPGVRQIFLDGVLDVDTTGIAFTASSTLWVGHDSSFFHGFLGQIASLRAWTRILTDEEIAAEAANNCFEPDNLTDIWGDWPLNAEPDGANDSQGSGHDWIVGGNVYITTNPPPLVWCEDSCQPGRDGGTDCASIVGDDEGDNCSAPWTIPTPAAFPTTPKPVYFDELEPDWGEHGQKFPDGDPQYNTIQASQIRRFAVEWAGLSKAEALALDAHWDSTRGGLQFALTNPHTGASLGSVRYESYERSPHQKVWAQTRSARLVKYTS